jgi:hypothetical protein
LEPEATFLRHASAIRRRDDSCEKIAIGTAIGPLCQGPEGQCHPPTLPAPVDYDFFEGRRGILTTYTPTAISAGSNFSAAIPSIHRASRTVDAAPKLLKPPGMSEIRGAYLGGTAIR